MPLPFRRLAMRWRWSLLLLIRRVKRQPTGPVRPDRYRCQLQADSPLVIGERLADVRVLFLASPGLPVGVFASSGYDVVRVLCHVIDSKV
jgi:hypothetical protein